jgi:hypothetical protein
MIHSPLGQIQNQSYTIFLMVGILKELELTRLKHVAIDEGYLFDRVVDLHLTKAGLKRASKVAPVMVLDTLAYQYPPPQIQVEPSSFA